MTLREAPRHPAHIVAPRRIRLHDVAVAAGVARSTAGLALRGAPRVAEDTRRRVRDAAEALGYVPDRLAARLRGGRAESVGLLLADVTDPAQARLLGALQPALEAAGFASFLAHAAESPERQHQALMRLRGQGVDGVLILPAAGSRPEWLATLDRWGLPWVTLLRGFRAGPHVGLDDRAGLGLATRHLIAEGHRRIAFLGGRQRMPSRCGGGPAICWPCARPGSPPNSCPAGRRSARRPGSPPGSRARGRPRSPVVTMWWPWARCWAWRGPGAGRRWR